MCRAARFTSSSKVGFFCFLGLALVCIQFCLAAVWAPTASAVPAIWVEDSSALRVRWDNHNANSYMCGVANAGDWNNDGYDDVVAGACGPGARSFYILFGKAKGFSPKEIDLEYLTPEQGVKYTVGYTSNDPGIANPYMGWSVDGGHDINNDGVDDVIVGAPRDVNPDHSGTGSVFVIFGAKDGFNAAGGNEIITTSNPPQGKKGMQWGMDGEYNGNDGLIFYYKSGVSGVGASVSFMNDDDDAGSAAQVIISDKYANDSGGACADDFSNGCGQVWVVKNFSGNGKIQLYAGNGDDGIFTKGCMISGGAEGDHLGTSVDGGLAGVNSDVTGDGISDLIIGAQRKDYSGRADAGAAYVVSGDACNVGGEINIDATFNLGNKGYAIYGAVANDHLGSSVSIIGNMDSDSYADIAVGAMSNDSNFGTDSGAVYALYGREILPFNGGGDMDLAPPQAISGKGFKAIGMGGGDEFGNGIAAVGDYNNDGSMDFVAAGHSAGYSADGFITIDSGGAWVIYGRTNKNSNDTLVLKTANSGLFGIQGGQAADLTLGCLAFDDCGGDHFGGQGFVNEIPVQAGAGGFAPLNDGPISGVGGGGDFNGDGSDDLIFSALVTKPTGKENTGSAYLVLGTAFDYPKPPNNVGFHFDCDPEQPSGFGIPNFVPARKHGVGTLSFTIQPFDPNKPSLETIDGMNFDENTGNIYGSPAKTTSYTKYKVTMSDAANGVQITRVINIATDGGCDYVDGGGGTLGSGGIDINFKPPVKENPPLGPNVVVDSGLTTTGDCPDPSQPDCTVVTVPECSSFGQTTAVKFAKAKTVSLGRGTKGRLVAENGNALSKNSKSAQFSLEVTGKKKNVKSVIFSVNESRVAKDSRAPFTAKVNLKKYGEGKKHALLVVVQTRSGKVVTLKSSFSVVKCPPPLLKGKVGAKKAKSKVDVTVRVDSGGPELKETTIGIPSGVTVKATTKMLRKNIGSVTLFQPNGASFSIPLKLKTVGVGSLSIGSSSAGRVTLKPGKKATVKITKIRKEIVGVRVTLKGKKTGLVKLSKGCKNGSHTARLVGRDGKKATAKNTLPLCTK